VPLEDYSLHIIYEYNAYATAKTTDDRRRSLGDGKIQQNSITPDGNKVSSLLPLQHGA